VERRPRRADAAEAPVVIDALIGQAYHLRFDPKLWQSMQPYPPLGSLYAAATVRAMGLQVAFHDAMLADGVNEWCAAVDRTRPRYAILYEDNFNYLTKMCLTRMRDAAVDMISWARRRGCTVIVAGSDPTDHPDHYLDAGAAFVIRGEGEETLQALLEQLEGRGGSLPDIAGLTWRDESAKRIDNPARAVIRAIDELPTPAWDLVDLRRYKRVWMERHGYFSINLVTTRGCPYHCNWCAKPLWGQRYNMHSAGYVADQLQWLMRECSPDHVWFMDDIMGLKKGWFGQFADELEARGIAIPFKCLSRADLLLRDGEIDAMARAGCEIVWIGAESGSQKVLDAMDKGTRVQDIYSAAEKLHAAGVKVAFFLQFGYPGEGAGEIEATRRMIRECAPDDIGISVAYPLPGTKFHGMVREQLGEKRNWVDSSDLAMMFKGPFTTDFYRHLHTVIHMEYRTQKTMATLRRNAEDGGVLAGLTAIDGRRAARLARDVAGLKRAERKLAKLAQVPHEGLAEMGGVLSPEEAAQPSPQQMSAENLSRETTTGHTTGAGAVH